MAFIGFEPIYTAAPAASKKTMLESKVVKIDPKIIISFSWSTVYTL